LGSGGGATTPLAGRVTESDGGGLGWGDER